VKTALSITTTSAEIWWHTPSHQSLWLSFREWQQRSPAAIFIITIIIIHLFPPSSSSGIFEQAEFVLKTKERKPQLLSLSTFALCYFCDGELAGVMLDWDNRRHVTGTTKVLSQRPRKGTIERLATNGTRAICDHQHCLQWPTAHATYGNQLIQWVNYLQKLVVALLTKSFCSFYVIQCFITVLTIQPLSSIIVRFKVLTAAGTKTAVFWVVVPSSLVEFYLRFGDAWCYDKGKYVWNVGKLLPEYMAQQPRRQPSSSSVISHLNAVHTFAIFLQDPL
jgi:hypothetical protein